MNLAFGKIVSLEERATIVEALGKSIAETLSQTRLSSSEVIAACDKLANSLGERHIQLLVELGVLREQAGQYVCEAKSMLSQSYLHNRLKKELGEHYEAENSLTFHNGTFKITEKFRPLGVLLHIAAGNQYGLALYSVVEGLLTGNINIVKLSSKDDSLSSFVLQELIRIEPKLAEYVYIFDYPSSEREAIARLADVANAVVIWGGDSAVQSVRNMVSPNTSVIEWGHKVSFAYVTKQGMTEEKLTGLAKNIVKTNQLLCSSCQGIYVDTESMDDIDQFCERFLPILDAVSQEFGTELPIEIRAQNAIRLYTESLEAAEHSCKIFKGSRTSVVAYEDNILKLSILHGSCWVKRLKKQDIVNVLRPNKNHLQTAALLCTENERTVITERLFGAGVIRITDGENMSELYPGAAHDGEYPLRQYTKIASVERII